MTVFFLSTPSSGDHCDEHKAPGTGANAGRFRGRDRDQFKRFSEIPNLLYTDGNEWALYRSGERAGAVVRFLGDRQVKLTESAAPDTHASTADA